MHPPIALQESLAGFDYPGRIVLLGRDGDSDVAVYAVTARSAASRAKVYVYDQDNEAISVRATDPEVMARGNMDLLDYSACHFKEGFLAIGNGRQVGAVAEVGKSPDAERRLRDALASWSYEPDKYSTPRVTGCIDWSCPAETAALSIIRSDGEGNSLRDHYPLTLEPGKGHFLCTYAGPDVRPTPSFAGDPVEVELSFGSAKECAEQVFAALPEAVRVSVIAVYKRVGSQEKEVAIVNEHGR